MKTMIYLNRWGHLFHLILVKSDGQTDYRQQSRICLTLGEARQVVEHWRQKYLVANSDIQDNSAVDLNDLLRGIATNFDPGQN